jgi:hypothetical protein
MMLWAVAAAILAFQQPGEDLAKQVEDLKQENAKLAERLAQLEQSSLEDARLVTRLRQLVKVLQEQVSALEAMGRTETPTGAPAVAAAPAAGPEKPVRGKVAYVDVKNGFITLGIGRREGVQVGYKFEIYREVAAPGGESRLQRLGMGQVEKFMGQESMAKVLISEGQISEMKVDDIAVAIRRLSPVAAPAPPPLTATPLPPGIEGKDGAFTITGNAGNAYILNYGSLAGAKQTDLVYAYHDGRMRAKLRLDRVEKGFSIANVVDGSMSTPPAIGDAVFVREPRKVLSGKVALSDDKRGTLAVDLRKGDGITVGTRLEARRLGQKVGTLLVTEVQTWGSWCRPDGESKIEDFRKGDFVEAIEEK